MPMSRRPRRPWLGSSTSPPLMTRSNLSVGPMAASARPPLIPNASAPAPAPASMWRREMRMMILPYGRDLIALGSSYSFRLERATAISQRVGDHLAHDIGKRGVGDLAHRDPPRVGRRLGGRSHARDV